MRELRKVKEKKRADKCLFFAVLGLLAFGAVFVYDASVISAYEDFGDKFHYIRYQVIWILLGTIALLSFSRIDYRFILRFSRIFFIATLVLLVLVLVPGVGVKVLGAKRWLVIFGMTIQPAEFAKLATILFLAKELSRTSKFAPSLFLKLLGYVILPVGLVLLEPDMGTAIIVVASGLSILFLAGLPFRYLMSLIPISITAIGTLIAIAPYRMRRLTSFLNPFEDTLGVSYHINQILLALGSGGLFGVGLGHSRQKYAFLPEATTDSIFAIIGEEIGFIGALVLIGVYVWIVWRGFMITKMAGNKEGKILAFGIISWVAIQALVNLAAMVSLIPLTGVPLPFISYGGSSMIAMLVGVGIVLNISKQAI